MIGKLQLLLLGLVSLYPMGCLAGREQGTAPLGRASFNDRTGQVTETDLYMRLPRVLAKYGFFIRSGESSYQSLTFETDWRTRKIFPDEQALGVTAARTKLRFRAIWNGKFYSLRLLMDNEVQHGSGLWIQGEPGKDFLAYAKEIANDIRAEVASGMRTF